MLRCAGFDASLTLESKLGEVFISLNCKVGRIVPPPSAPKSSVSSKVRSPSYYRRQERRKASRISQSPRVFESHVSSLAEQVKKESVVGNMESCMEAEVDTADCVDAEEGILSNENVIDEAEYVFEEKRVEVNIPEEDGGLSSDEESVDLGDQLKAIILESKKNREKWDSAKVLKENG